MPLTRLTLRDFRNHAATRLEGTARFNVLIGENGAGKTNVLEAISLLITMLRWLGPASRSLEQIQRSHSEALAADTAQA